MLRYWKGLKLYERWQKNSMQRRGEKEQNWRREEKTRKEVLCSDTEKSNTGRIWKLNNDRRDLFKKLHWGAVVEIAWGKFMASLERAMEYTMGVSAEKAQGESGVSSVESIQSLKVWMATHLGSVHTVRQTAMLHLGSSAALSHLFRLKENITTAVHSIHILALKATLRSCWVVRKWVWSWAHCWGQLARSMWINQD